jgi:acylphosphatase
MDLRCKFWGLRRFLKVFYMITRRLRISGRVQGVGYRQALCGEAARHGLTGWVRNRIDGTVEAVVQGEPEAVEKLVQWARQGPPASWVADMRIETLQEGEAPRFTRFEHRPTT